MDASPPAWLRVMTHCRLGASARPRDMMRSLTVPGTGPNVPTPSRWIPVPDVPVYPVLSIASLRAGGAEHFPNVMDAGPAVYFRMARYAILQALRLMGVKAEERVLVPAYHCSSMIAPITYCARKAKPNTAWPHTLLCLGP